MSAIVNRQHTIHSGRVFDLVTENITLTNGVTVDMDLIRHPGAAAIVALDDSDNVVLIHQYRHAVGARIWEIPAGTMAPAESPLECAQRELTEETGYTASRFQKLAEILPVPGYSDERIHLFIATGLGIGTRNLDADELVDVRVMPFKEALEMVTSGRILDSKTITGLLMTASHIL